MQIGFTVMTAGAPGEPLPTQRVPGQHSPIEAQLPAFSARKEVPTLSFHMLSKDVLQRSTAFPMLMPMLTAKPYQNYTFQQPCKFSRKAVRIKIPATSWNS